MSNLIINLNYILKINITQTIVTVNAYLNVICSILFISDSLFDVLYLSHCKSSSGVAAPMKLQYSHNRGGMHIRKPLKDSLVMVYFFNGTNLA